MTPSHLRKAGRLYRYYVATDAIRIGHADCPVRSVPAAEIEGAVVAQVRHLLETPEIVARTWTATNPEGKASVPEREVVARISEFAPLDGSFSRRRRRASSACWSSASIWLRTTSWCGCRPRGPADTGRGAPVAGGEGSMKTKRQVAGKNHAP